MRKFNVGDLVVVRAPLSKREERARILKIQIAEWDSPSDQFEVGETIYVLDTRPGLPVHLQPAFAGRHLSSIQ